MFAKFSQIAAAATIITMAMTAQAAPSPASLMRRTNVGDATFYTPGLGACGITNTESDMIAAVSEQFFDSFPGATPNPNLNPLCGRAISVSSGGKTIQVTIVDRYVEFTVSPWLAAVPLWRVGVSFS
ncbi:hypothetical protein D9758_017267 [Tetrapyrgos nigripes]|uniref:Uncharacterized protein n=1 Tax=Tetrapyrgos nigripes TaxID=182062 RepID=A0A8H5C5P2_9AGAR|nr:hypothetical protein D9758_017267 [Tetrapyrgos nigripes]